MGSLMMIRKNMMSLLGNLKSMSVREDVSAIYVSSKRIWTTDIEGNSMICSDGRKQGIVTTRKSKTNYKTSPK